MTKNIFMDSLPVEALYNIICNLPLNYMFDINKQFNQLYTEHYYKYYIHNKYAALNLKVKTSYKDLCCDSLQEGSLIFREKNKPQQQLLISGVRAAKSAFNSLHLILRFNNDLYVYDDKTVETSFIEENINDFDTNTYVKENKWYYLFEFDDSSVDRSTRLVKEIDEPFKHVAYYDEYVFAVTDHKLYRLEITTKTVLEYPINNSVSPIIGLNIGGITDVSLLLSDGSLLLFTGNMLELGAMDNVETVQGNIIKVDGKYHFCRDNRFAFQNMDHDENLFSEIYSGVVSYPLKRNIVGCINYDVCYFLTDKGLYSIDYSNNIKRCHKNTNDKKIKRITGNWEGCYEFY
jgi:hypothetical protein